MKSCQRHRLNHGFPLECGVVSRVKKVVCMLAIRHSRVVLPLVV